MFGGGATPLSLDAACAEVAMCKGDAVKPAADGASLACTIRPCINTSYMPRCPLRLPPGASGWARHIGELFFSWQEGTDTWPRYVQIRFRAATHRIIPEVF